MADTISSYFWVTVMLKIKDLKCPVCGGQIFCAKLVLNTRRKETGVPYTYTITHQCLRCSAVVPARIEEKRGGLLEYTRD